MRILILLSFFQIMIACEQGPEALQPWVEGVTAPTSKPQNAQEPVASGIVFQSKDGGYTWQDVSAGLPVKYAPNGVLIAENQVFMVNEFGMYRSRNTAETPVWEKDLLMDKLVMRILPGRAGPYASVYDEGIFQQIKGADVWVPVFTSLKDKRLFSVLEAGNGTLLIGGEQGIYQSTDKGISWNRVHADGVVTCLLETENALLAGGNEGILRSTDGGAHWELILSEDGPIKNLTALPDRVVSVSLGAEPWKEKPEDRESRYSRLRFSTDGGKSWQRMDAGLPALPYVFDQEEREFAPGQTINDVEQIGRWLYCAHITGLLRSADGGRTWETVLPNTNGKMFQLSVSGNTVYAVQVFTGC